MALSRALHSKLAINWVGPWFFRGHWILGGPNVFLQKMMQNIVSCSNSALMIARKSLLLAGEASPMFHHASGRLTCYVWRICEIWSVNLHIAQHWHPSGHDLLQGQTADALCIGHQRLYPDLRCTAQQIWSVRQK